MRHSRDHNKVALLADTRQCRGFTGREILSLACVSTLPIHILHYTTKGSSDRPSHPTSAACFDTMYLSWALSLGFLCVLLAGYLVYNALLPKPIQGIPYNRHAAKRILGDGPEAMQHIGKTKQVFSFLAEQLVKHNSPIIQLFMRPGGRPWVIISDFRESQDIMVRRTREFDRSDFFGDIFVATIPENQVTMKTNDVWRTHRRVMGDTMSPSFLNNVAAPQIYDTALELVNLWREKERLAAGRPFNVSDDVYKGALDVIWAATLATDSGTTKKQQELLANTKHIDLSQDVNTAVTFPTAKDPPAFEAILTVVESTGIAMKSMTPRFSHKFALHMYPTLRRAVKTKDRLLTDSLEMAWRKFSSGTEEEDDVKCALDLIVQRESSMAKKEGRAPAYDTPAIRDELFGFLFAGHETTSTSTCW
jgi:cytochrome P450